MKGEAELPNSFHKGQSSTQRKAGQSTEGDAGSLNNYDDKP